MHLALPPPSFSMVGMAGLMMVVGLTAAAVAIHHVPLGLRDAPAHVLGWLALIGLLGLYLFLALLQRQPRPLLQGK